ncbi:MAG: hypothetical protein ACAI44_19400 [Candidatus Sericytochromatia bacterium]
MKKFQAHRSKEPVPSFDQPEKFAEFLRHLAGAIHGVIPELGFCLLVWEFGDKGRGDWISNVDRESLVKALREAAEKIENFQTYNPSSSN